MYISPAHGGEMQQNDLFDDTRSAIPGRHQILGAQADIRYYATSARSVLNGPETTGMGFWSINPYVGCAFGCAYCYARFAHSYVVERAATDVATEEPLGIELTELPPWLAFERRIFVKRNAATVLRQQLARGSGRVPLGRNTTIVVGTATDPYQPAERTFRVTREVLEVLADHARIPVVIITKSPLVTRDVDVLRRLSQRARLTVHLSLITLDREIARRIEPRSPTPESRLRALARLSEAGIDVGVNIMPVLPGITDHPSALEALVRRVAVAGASHVNVGALRLQRTARQRYLPVLEAEFPQLAERYRNAYAGTANMSERYREGLGSFMKRVCREAGIRYGSSQNHDESAGPQPESEEKPENGVAGQGSTAIERAPVPATEEGGDRIDVRAVVRQTELAL